MAEGKGLWGKAMEWWNTDSTNAAETPTQSAQDTATTTSTAVDDTTAQAAGSDAPTDGMAQAAESDPSWWDQGIQKAKDWWNRDDASATDGDASEATDAASTKAEDGKTEDGKTEDEDEEQEKDEDFRVRDHVEGEEREGPVVSIGKGLVHLIFYTSSIKQSDKHTFASVANALVRDYKRHYPDENVVSLYVESGREIVKAINSCPKRSIISMDIISHSNAGGVHISKKLDTPEKAGRIKGTLHYRVREQSDKPQTEEDAEYMEECYHGLYKDRASGIAVGVYFNQTATNGIAYLSQIKFNRFAKECFVELHGCKTAQVLTQYWDNFALQLSQDLPSPNTVVGHEDRSNPNSPKGYRHGVVGVYRDGAASGSGERSGMGFEHSSTPVPSGGSSQRGGSDPAAEKQKEESWWKGLWGGDSDETAEDETAEGETGSNNVSSGFKNGDRGAGVKSLQQQLIKDGYLAEGEDDGVYGSKTQAAWDASQKGKSSGGGWFKGLFGGGEAAGGATEATSSAAKKAASSSGSGFKSGDRGAGVKALQEKLIKDGYLDGNADGIYGPKTDAAYKASQQGGSGGSWFKGLFGDGEAAGRPQGGDGGGQQEQRSPDGDRAAAAAAQVRRLRPRSGRRRLRTQDRGGGPGVPEEPRPEGGRRGRAADAQGADGEVEGHFSFFA